VKSTLERERKVPEAAVGHVGTRSHVLVWALVNLQQRWIRRWLAGSSGYTKAYTASASADVAQLALELRLFAFGIVQSLTEAITEGEPVGPRVIAAWHARCHGPVGMAAVIDKASPGSLIQSAESKSEHVSWTVTRNLLRCWDKCCPS